MYQTKVHSSTNKSTRAVVLFCSMVLWSYGPMDPWTHGVCWRARVCIYTFFYNFLFFVILVPVDILSFCWTAENGSSNGVRPFRPPPFGPSESFTCHLDSYKGNKFGLAFCRPPLVYSGGHIRGIGSMGDCHRPSSPIRPLRPVQSGRRITVWTNSFDVWPPSSNIFGVRFECWMRVWE